MALNIGNCPRCGRVFAKGFRDVCPACVKEIDAEYERCFKYLRENQGVTIHELSEATNVSVRQITRFIREGRISLVGAPNMSYPCESCGNLIREGPICDACRKRLSRDVKVMQQIEQAKQERLEKQKEQSTTTYQIFDTDK